MPAINADRSVVRQFRICASRRRQGLGQRIVAAEGIRSGSTDGTVDKKHSGLRNVDDISSLYRQIHHCGVFTVGDLSSRIRENHQIYDGGFSFATGIFSVEKDLISG